eukprot:TRINITY_DN923_c0_g2_i1.p1 TRINITY_DN923_c0_g2~~TRINITY_DN923_c0_g2_i1.p1  ORF type:complete len:968 (+),score=225.49 TRINITY_DN923_c0_g2_i1:94-2997(+)
MSEDSLSLELSDVGSESTEMYSGSSSFTWSPDRIRHFMSNHSVDDLEELGGQEGVARLLKTDLRNGLEERGDFADREEYYGLNFIPIPEGTSWLELFIDAWKDEALMILTVAAFVALIAGVTSQLLKLGENGWIDGVAILTTCLIVTLVTSTNDYMKDLQFRKLRSETEKNKMARVVRQGEEKKMFVHEILVGDIVRIYSGDKIPADGLFISDMDEILVNESEVTGEVDDLVKNRDDPFLLLGCPVKKGSGTMLVLAVGVNTEWGRTMEDVESEETPLQDKLNVLVRNIGYVGMVVAAIVFFVLCGWYIHDNVIHPDMVVNCTDDPSLLASNITPTPDPTSNVTYDFLCNSTLVNDSGATLVPDEPYKIRVPSSWQAQSLIEVLRAFLVAVTIVVVAVPEGLPLAVTISLAYSMQKMLADQNFVRHLAACETMGGATNICTDKTGTLTENKMKVVCGSVAGEKCLFSNTNGEDFQLPHFSPLVLDLLVNSLSLNVEDGKLEKKIVRGKEVVSFIGSSTECAFLVLAESLGAKPELLQKRNKAVKFYQFNSDRKRMSRAFPLGDSGKIRLYVKGAAELIISLCTRGLNSEGSISHLSEERLEKIMRSAKKYQAAGLRTLAIAFRDFDGPQDWSSDGSGFEEDLTLIGILAIEDPIREEVPLAVAKCMAAGITVRMITGDNLLTAKKIASQCGILTPSGIFMEGKEFRDMSVEERVNLLRRTDCPLQVLARAIPNDKLILVKTLKELGEVVAVTGDGTNDGPALKEADVGLAMGICGTEVAREMSDIIILDDNFVSIVTAVKWGRCVYDNIRKFLQFQLTVNVVALVTAFIGAVSAYGTPLTAVQLLWVNMIMDTMAALALGTEKPQDRLLYRKPYGREGKLITAVMWRNIIGQSFFQVLVMMAILYPFDSETNHHVLWNDLESGKDHDGPSLHYTFLFNTFVFLQIFNEINSRKVNKGRNLHPHIQIN